MIKPAHAEDDRVARADAPSVLQLAFDYSLGEVRDAPPGRQQPGPNVIRELKSRAFFGLRS